MTPHFKILRTRKMVIIGFSLLFLLIMILAYLSYLYIKVIQDASSYIKRGAIDSVIDSESHVFYDDEMTSMGVFFEKTHRKHIHYKDIPPYFIMALVASEDNNFFHHHGVDWRSIIRALAANVKAGKIVQGGSTLTQQTAKNIFKREKRSYIAKLKELIQSFLFESKYSKDEILEMYTNQFFVTGYGKGLGIAAQYYFDKDVQDLDLLETAFIAGSVKGPNRYNPFIKKTPAEKEGARQRAKLRTAYVLKKMLEMNFITQQQYLHIITHDIPFKEGNITFRLNVMLDYVREQLESSFFKNILHDQGLDNFATSGIQIYTSINKNIQEACTKSLRSHLSLMNVQLNGYNLKKMQERYKELFNNGAAKHKGIPILVKITNMVIKNQGSHIEVKWAHGKGIIDYEGIKEVGSAWLKWKLGNWAIFSEEQLPNFLDNFHPGDLIPVQIIPSENEEFKLVLSAIPELEGGGIVIHKGVIKAMAGGYCNQYFNRAIDAKRQLGSIFKPILYTAALQLKWNTLDSLQNLPEMYSFQNTFYTPRSDHKPKSPLVSMAWAGAKSENLATVWLLYHLTDHLNLSEFQKITKLVDLNQKQNESYLAYKKRIRDKYGVVVDREALMEAAFHAAKKDISSDLIFGGYEQTINSLKRLHFDIKEEHLNGNKEEKNHILRFSFKRLLKFEQEMQETCQGLLKLIKKYKKTTLVDIKHRLANNLQNFYFLTKDGEESKLIFTKTPEIFESVRLQPLSTKEVIENPDILSIDDCWIEGLLPANIIGLLQAHLINKYQHLLSYNKYDPMILSQVRDFRTLVNLLYVVSLSKGIGISSNLKPVLSFPLGPNAISLVEAALTYQTIMTGQIYPLDNGIDPERALIITKICDRDGEVIWKNSPQSKRILSKRISGLISEILRKAIEVGTGRKAKDKIQLLIDGEGEKIGVSIPAFGKTGTSNFFTNASFVGFIPGPFKETGQLNLKEGYVIATYVGYDDNRPMKGKRMSIYGSSGALPIWIDTANAIVNSKNFKDNIHLAALAFEGIAEYLPYQNHFEKIPVSSITGLTVKDNPFEYTSYPCEIFGDMINLGDEWEKKRLFEPFEGNYP